MSKTSAATRVLVIDADNVRRGMLACTLPASRYRLTFARSLEQGLDLLADQQPQLVLVGGTGADDACHRIRALPSGQACTLVLMDESFRDETTGRSRADLAGAEAHLPFPFEVEQLEQTLADVAVRDRSARERQPTASTALERPVQPREASPAPPPSETPEDQWTAFRDRVSQLHRGLDGLTYYQLLQVAPEASTAAIKQAYFERSMELHPDRFMRLEDHQLKEMIYDVFKRMSEAFKVLANPEARSRYDANLSGSHPELRYLERAPEPTAADPLQDALTPAGRKYLRFALLAEEDGNPRSARMYLSMAMQYEPDNEALHQRLKLVTRQLDS